MIKGILKRILPKFFIEYIRLIKNRFSNLSIITLYRIKRRINPPKLPINKDGKIFIHLGCGDQNDKRFINVDVLPLPHVHYVQGVENLKVFPNKYADLIYASHILEHISHCKLITTLREWRRVLKNGGVLRISVPDFDKIINIYKLENNNINKIKGALMGGQDYKYNFHKSVFNKEYLTELLLFAGFDSVRLWTPENAEFYSFNDWASKYIETKYPVSLNLEAVK